MMKPTIAALRMAVRNWNSEYVSREVNKANRRAWLRAIAMLGDKWLLLQQVERRK